MKINTYHLYAKSNFTTCINVGIGFERLESSISTLGKHGKLFLLKNNVIDTLSKYSVHNFNSVEDRNEKGDG